MSRHPCKICHNTGHTASQCDKKRVRGALVYMELRCKMRDTKEYWDRENTRLRSSPVFRNLSPEEAKDLYIQSNLKCNIEQLYVLDLNLLGQFISNGVVQWIPVLRRLIRGDETPSEEDNVPATEYKKRNLRVEIFNYMYQMRRVNLFTEELITHISQAMRDWESFQPLRNRFSLIWNYNPTPKKRLKITVSKDENIMVKDEDDCPICMESMSDNKVIMNCNHMCCATCLKRVLETKPTCCLCRANVTAVKVTNCETSKCFESIRI